MDTQKRGELFSTYLGNELSGAIKARGKSALWVAERIGVDRVSLSRYLNGHRLMPASVLANAAEAIDMSPETVVERAYARLLAECGPPSGYGSTTPRGERVERNLRAVASDDPSVDADVESQQEEP